MATNNRSQGRRRNSRVEDENPGFDLSWAENVSEEYEDDDDDFDVETIEDDDFDDDDDGEYEYVDEDYDDEEEYEDYEEDEEDEELELEEEEEDEEDDFEMPSFANPRRRNTSQSHMIVDAFDNEGDEEEEEEEEVFIPQHPARRPQQPPQAKPKPKPKQSNTQKKQLNLKPKGNGSGSAKQRAATASAAMASAGVVGTVNNASLPVSQQTQRKRRPQNLKQQAKQQRTNQRLNIKSNIVAQQSHGGKPFTMADMDNAPVEIDFSPDKEFDDGGLSIDYFPDITQNDSLTGTTTEDLEENSDAAVIIDKKVFEKKPISIGFILAMVNIGLNIIGVFLNGIPVVALIMFFVQAILTIVGFVFSIIERKTKRLVVPAIVINSILLGLLVLSLVFMILGFAAVSAIVVAAA